MGQVAVVCKLWVVADGQEGALGRRVQDQVEVRGPWVQASP